jgi:hypothetical protein
VSASFTRTSRLPLLQAEGKLPPQFGTFKQAQRVKEEQGAQLAFDVE